MTELRGMLTRAQVERLMSAIDQSHVEKKQNLSYISQHQARAEMIRIFGVGNWDSQLENLDLIYETKIEKGDVQYPGKGDGKPYWVTCYRATVRVRIRDYFGLPIAEFVEAHAEENAPLPNRGEAHAMAITSVESYALRRSLIGLGDRLGLGLYDGGSMNKLVKGTLQLTDPDSPLYIPKDSTETAPAEPVGGRHQGAFKRAETSIEQRLDEQRATTQ